MLVLHKDRWSAAPQVYGKRGKENNGIENGPREGKKTEGTGNSTHNVPDEVLIHFEFRGERHGSGHRGNTLTSHQTLELKRWGGKKLAMEDNIEITIRPIATN